MIDTSTLLRIIDIQGLEAAEPQVARMVSTARRRGINTAAVDVLADRGQPEVARLRALARVQRDLSEALVHRTAAA